MFTGIIEELGTVTTFERHGDIARLAIAASTVREPHVAVGRLREHRGAVEIGNAPARPIDREDGSQRREERDEENQFLAVGQP